MSSINESEPGIAGLSVVLRSPTDAKSTNLGRAIHALCFHWLSLANATLAERSHQQNTPPFSVAIRTVSPKQIYLRIGLLQKELLSSINSGTSLKKWGRNRHDWMGTERYIV